jgi:hypothetical protein
MTTTTTPGLPLPAGSITVYHWYDTDTPEPGRYFRGGSWVIERDNRDTDMCLQVDGVQRHDGTVERLVVLDDDDLTVDQARQLAAALIAACDEVDKMAEYDNITV